MTVAELFSQPLRIINVGLTSFAEDLNSLLVEVEQVNIESGSEKSSQDGRETNK
jgi:hypothetical protein